VIFMGDCMLGDCLAREALCAIVQIAQLAVTATPATTPPTATAAAFAVSLARLASFRFHLLRLSRADVGGFAFDRRLAFFLDEEWARPDALR
jgi:hypothetical protein